MTIVTLTTDFGLSDPFVGIMKGVILGRAPDVSLVDLTHGIPPQDVMGGALALRHSVPYFPAGTVHLAVVDPGVGSARRPLCVETTRGFLVGPDNGLLSLAASPDETRRIVHLTEERFFLSPRSATFHGRDVFAPVAAALASGTLPTELGPVVPDMERLQVAPPLRRGRTLHGEIIYVDRFGNLVTNVPQEMLAGPVVIGLGPARVRGMSGSYASVRRGEPVAVVGSWGLLEIAVREGSARDGLGGRIGDPVTVEPA